MKKITVFIIAILFSLNCFSQTIIKTAFFPILDSMGVKAYIKKSDIKEYNHPQKNTKIFRYNEQLDTIGYWVGSKMKYVSFPSKKISKKIIKRAGKN